MGMFAFKLTLLFCSLTIYKSLHAASVLENSSDLWRNWLLNENEEIPSQQSPPLSRRITPKSIFVAPTFNKCPQGTLFDENMNQCVKKVMVDYQANLLNKLKAVFAQTSSKPIATSNETSSTTRGSLSTIVTTTTTTRTTTTTSTTEVDMPNSTLLPKESQLVNNTTDIPAADISGPLQLSIPFNSKNSSEETYDEVSSSIRTNVTNLSNESDITTTTFAVQNPSELVTNKYDLTDTTISPALDVTVSTVYPDANTAESVASVLPDVEYSTEMTTESTTMADLPTETTPVPKKYYVHKRPVQEQVTSKPERTYITSRRPAALNEPKLTVTPVADLVYSYTSGDILKIPVRFPEYVGDNKSSTDRAALNRLREYHKQNNSVRGSAFHNGAFSTPNISDISDSTSTVSDSSSINNSNNLILSSNSARNDLYQKLPSNGKIRPKCDPSTGYGDCTSPSKLDSLTGSDKGSYLVNVNRGSVSPVTTIIRFPSVYPKGTSVVRFPTSGGTGGIIADQQFKPSSNVDETVAFPEMEIGAASRYWESNRFPASYWNPWDASKPHFVRVWPSNVGTPGTTTYNLGGDINYNYRSQADYV